MASEQFYHYVKGPKKGGIWTPVPVEDEARLNGKSVYFRTILACSAKVSYGAPMPDPQHTYYKGPFYLDIDEEHLKKALSSAVASVEALLNIGVREQDIYVWLSGKKGFHILVPQECFLPAEPTLWLPRIHKNIAKDLKLGIDYRVYSLGRGRMWRVSGKQRQDNQLYKVQVSLQELFEMRPADYIELCREPREERPIGPGVLARGAGPRVARALAMLEDEQKLQAVFVDPDELEALQEEPYRLPPCGQMMVAGDFREGVGFNDASVQFAKVLATFGGAEPDQIVQEFVNNTHGETYNTPSKRLTQLQSAMPAAKSYAWSCKAALSVLPGAPCENCPVSYLLYEANAEESNDEGVVDLSQVDDLSKIPVVKLNGHRAPTPEPPPQEPDAPAGGWDGAS